MIKKILLSCSFSILFSLPALAELNIVTSYPYIEELVKQVGKDKVKVTALASGNWDPHFVVAKPSLIVKARKANLMIINGGELEIGWLPPVIRQANNAEIQTGTSGFLDLSGVVKLIQVPTNVSRSEGDLHSLGNPHYSLDPYNMTLLSKAITQRMSKLDPENATYYSDNNKAFTKEWKKSLSKWSNQMKKVKGIKVFQYHRIYDYFIQRFGLVLSANLEPVPGIMPTAKHLNMLIQTAKEENVKYIFQDIYHPQDPAEFLSSKTGLKILKIPHDVNAVKEADSLFSLFDTIVDKVTQ
jgi:zinc/manganese transport system substrate-binding protein